MGNPFLVMTLTLETPPGVGFAPTTIRIIKLTLSTILMIAHIRPHHVRHVKGLVITILPTANSNLSAKEKLKPLGGKLSTRLPEKEVPRGRTKRNATIAANLGIPRTNAGRSIPNYRIKGTPAETAKIKIANGGLSLMDANKRKLQRQLRICSQLEKKSTSSEGTVSILV